MPTVGTKRRDKSKLEAHLMHFIFDEKNEEKKNNKISITNVKESKTNARHGNEVAEDWSAALCCVVVFVLICDFLR